MCRGTCSDDDAAEVATVASSSVLTWTQQLLSEPLQVSEKVKEV